MLPSRHSQQRTRTGARVDLVTVAQLVRRCKRFPLAAADQPRRHLQAFHLGVRYGRCPPEGSPRPSR